MVVDEKKRLVLSNWSPQRASKLVLVKSSSCGGKVIARIQVGIAEKLEEITMKVVRPRLRNYVNVAAGIATIFGIEVTGENAEFGNGVQVRNDCGSSIDVFFGIAPVDNEGVGKLSLAVDRNGSRI